MMEELGVFPHNMANSSPVIFGDLIFVSTSNGQDESHVQHPVAAVRRRSSRSTRRRGKLVWEDTSPGEKILHGQWSSPAVGKIGDTAQVDHRPGRRLGARLRGEDRQEALGVRHATRRTRSGRRPATRVITHAGHLREHRLHRQRPGPGARRGRRPPLRHRPDQDAATSPRPARSGTTTKIRRSDLDRRDLQRHHLLLGLQRLPARVDVKTGKPYWTHDMLAAIWGSPIVHRRQGLPRRRGRRRRRAGRRRRRRR